MKPKILILTNHSYMLYRFRKELIFDLSRECEVVLSMPFVGHEQDFMDMGIRCIDTPMERRDITPADELKLMLTYFSMIRKERPDCVITYSIKPNIYAGLCCRFLCVPYYCNIQGLGTAFQRPKLEKAVSWLYKQALHGAKTVFFENQSNAEIFRIRGIIPHDKQVVLPGAGINLEEYPLIPYPRNDDFHFLYLGRIMQEKGVDELFAATKKLYQKYGSKVKLDIVGFFDSEDYTDRIKELEDLGIAKFHGFQSNPIPYYEKADCIVLPSYHEGMSNVLLEAAAIGRPLITTEIPGCRESVEARATGLLCPSRNTEALYECMEEMLLMSLEDREAMGKAGHMKMEREFDRKKVIGKISNIIRKGSKASV